MPKSPLRPNVITAILQVTIPALFMLLLVWIKSLTTVFDSPSASYSCGQTIPWQYEDGLDPASVVQTPLFQCLQRPPNCTEDKYYRDEGGIFEQMGLEGVSDAWRASMQTTNDLALF